MHSPGVYLTVIWLANILLWHFLSNHTHYKPRVLPTLMQGKLHNAESRCPFNDDLVGLISRCGGHADLCFSWLYADVSCY